MTAANGSADAPNVLVVLTDQQRWDTVGAYDSPMDLTPNLDAMAERGTLLEHTISPNPVCGPARETLQTGRYWSRHRGQHGTPVSDDDNALARTFARHGYRTGYVGKWHLGGTMADPVPEEKRAGYEYWRAADGLEYTSHPYEGLVYDEDNEPVTFDGYRVDALTDMAVSFLDRQADREDPFLLFLSYLEPHQQNDMWQYVAPDGYAERYSDPYVPSDLRDQFGNSANRERGVDWLSQLPDYYGACARIDECLGRLLDELDERDILEETVVLFTSDHGCHFWTRPGVYKRSPHESSIRVPGVIAGPGFDGGHRIGELVSLVDVAPTLLDAAGIGIPDTTAGESIRPLIEGSTDNWRDAALLQTSDAGRGIRTDRWKYHVSAIEDDPDGPTSDPYVERYLYDLAADPYEQVNLVGRAEYRDVADNLRERLRDRMRAAGDPPVEIRAAER